MRTSRTNADASLNSGNAGGIKISIYDLQKSCSIIGHPVSLGGAVRAIVTTREAGSDGREAAGSVSLDAPTNGSAWT